MNDYPIRCYPVYFYREDESIHEPSLLHATLAIRVRRNGHFDIVKNRAGEPANDVSAFLVATALLDNSGISESGSEI